MSNFLKPLSYIKSPDLINFNRDDLVNEIITRIQADPNWNSLWDGELLHNFSFFIINTFSYLFSKNAEAMNRILRETFITEANDTASVINYMSNFGMNLKQNESSMVEVTVSPTDGGSFPISFLLPSGFKLNARTINGDLTTYEIYNFEYDDNGNITTKLDYRSSIAINASNFTKVNAFSGSTKSINITLNPINETEKFVYNINDQDIIENSIRIYYEYDTINEIELIETNSFVINPIIKGPFTAEMGGVPHFIIKYNTDGSAKIIFGSREFGGSFPNSPSNITFIYRIGGGLLTNISRRAISDTFNLQISDFASISVSFYNLLGGGGGSDREDINYSQFYAPYRISRQKSIVDDRDVLNTLNLSVIKHLVKSPKYNGVNVPILHYHNYIAPPRVFSDFIFPIPNTTDNYLTYKDVFEIQLNDFLNLQGIHDGSEKDILMSFFSSNDFSFPLPYKPPLNGSLYVSAYDSQGVEIDRLVWGQNYNGTINLADIPLINASITSQSVIGSLGINLGSQYLYILIDSSITIGTGNYNDIDTTANCFRIEISPNQYTIDSNEKATSLAAEIDNKIRAASDYYNSFDSTLPFAYINDDKKLVIRSLSTGKNSDIQIFNFSTDSILSTLSLNPQKTYAYPQSRKVFLDSSNYDFESHEVFIKLNKTNMYYEKEYTNVVPIWQDPNSSTGPVIIIYLLDENNLPILLIENSKLTIEAIDSSETTIDTLDFISVSSSILNFGAANTFNAFDDQNNNTCNYDYETGKITFKLLDSNGDSPDYSFPTDEDGITQLYNTTTKFKITCNIKTYNVVTVTMTPNPYFPESEAYSYLLKLRNSDKKMIGIEPLIKKVNFKPFLLELKITPAKGYSREDAFQSLNNLIYNNFTYNNMVSDISIGTGFKLQILRSFLNDKIRLPSVDTIEIISPITDLTDINENIYYFIFNESFLSRIFTFERQYPQLTGLRDSYKPRVNIA